MIYFLRKHHRWVWVIIAILCIPFVFYFVQRPDYGALTSNEELGRIYDRPVTLVEYNRNAHLLTLARYLGLSLPSDLMTTNVRTENDMYVEFTWNRLVMRHEAREMGISPTSSEIAEYVKTLSRFKGDDGNFDFAKYDEFAKEVLPSLGFTVSQLEEVVSDQLSLNRMRDLIAVGTQIPDSESKENYETAYGKLHVAVVRLSDRDFASEVNIQDADITKYFESHKEQLKSDEKRKVEFVSFSLTDDEKKLTGKERVDALQRVSDKTTEFSQALLEKDAKFADIASRFQTPVVTTEPFTVAAPPPEFAPNPQLTQYAFQATLKDPISDAIQGPDGFYILHLLEVAEAKPLELADAKPKIIETMTTERLHQLKATKGAEIAQQIRDALAAGTSIDLAIARTKIKLLPWWPAELVTQLGLRQATEESPYRLERVPPFAPADTAAPAPETEPEPRYETEDLPMIRSTVANMQPGEVSEFTPTADGGFVLVVEKRDPVDAGVYAEARIKSETANLTNRRKAVFVEWMRDRRKAARVVGPVASTGQTS